MSTQPLSSHEPKGMPAGIPEALPTQHVEETVLVVPSMHCAGCMGKVERGLCGVSGVVSARVNLSARQVRVAHNVDISAPELIAILEGLGFPAQVRADELEAPRSDVKPLLAPLAVAGFASMNVMLLSVSNWSGAEGATRVMFHWLSALIGIPAIVYAGMPFFRSAWAALQHWRTNMDVPISIGVVLATLLSLYETITHGEHAWFDGTLMLLFFLLAGRTLDAMMRDRAREGVDALLRQAASGATVVGPKGVLQWVAARDLLPGMVIRIPAGERLAADGVIIAGQTSLDQSLLTGESTPIAAETGALVHAGTLNRDAPIDVRITAAGQDTSLAEIARLMDVSGQSRSAYVRIADRASKLYAPVVHLVAALTFIGWLMFGASVYQAAVIAIAVLIITCPCAIGLAVPVAQVVGCGTLMRGGILVKDGSALERLATVDRALLDKTGTLTMGQPMLLPESIHSLVGDEKAALLALASHSHHPLSRALAKHLTGQGIRAAVLEDVTEEAGMGVNAMWHGVPVALRRPDSLDGRSGTGLMASLFTVDGQERALLHFDDPLRPDAVMALERLRQLGVQPSILSGDNARAVALAAQTLGLEATAQASPSDKCAAIEAAKAQNRGVLMVGDGLNDGPALAAADASIAPGTASDVGRQAADFVFLSDSLMALPRAIDTSRRVMRIVRENFVLAIGYNVFAVPLAIFGFITPLWAAVAMATSSLIVIANSLRLAYEPRWKTMPSIPNNQSVPPADFRVAEPQGNAA